MKWWNSKFNFSYAALEMNVVLLTDASCQPQAPGNSAAFRPSLQWWAICWRRPMCVPPDWEGWSCGDRQHNSFRTWHLCLGQLVLTEFAHQQGGAFHVPECPNGLPFACRVGRESTTPCHISELRELNSNHRQCLVSCSILSEFPGYKSQNCPTPHLLYLFLS